jgi:hypothetical protein
MTAVAAFTGPGGRFTGCGQHALRQPGPRAPLRMADIVSGAARR